MFTSISHALANIVVCVELKRLARQHVIRQYTLVGSVEEHDISTIGGSTWQDSVISAPSSELRPTADISTQPPQPYP